MASPLIYLVRHGDTDFNDAKRERLRGHLDVPLNKEGHRAAEELGVWFANKPVWFIASSPLSRTWDTATTIADFTGASVVECFGAKTWNTGDLDGKFIDEVNPVLDFLITNPTIIAPNGESYGEFLNRWGLAFRSLSRAQQSDPSRHILVVTHQANILAVRGGFKPEAVNDYEESIPQPGGIVAVSISPKGYICKVVKS